MPSESDLRDLLQGADPEGRVAIDLDAVLTRARRRRRPRLIAAQALGSVALVGVLVTAVGVSLPRGGESAASIAADTAGGAETQSAPFVDQDARKVGDECGQPLAPTATEPWNLELVVTSADSTQLTATATQTIADEDAHAGRDNSIGALSISRGGAIVAHAVVGDITTHFEEGLGRTGFWEGRFDIVPCEGISLSAGTYEVRPTVVVMTSGVDVSTETLYGAPVPFEIQ